MRIGIFGTFDVENYGDLLFPIIAEQELRERLGDIELVRFSYRNKDRLSWYFDVVSVARMYSEPLVCLLDCILIGGGHLVRFDKVVAHGYEPPIPEIAHPTGYWLAPALAGISCGVPVIWNAPSASETIPRWAELLVNISLSGSVYVAMRDQSSVDALRTAGFQGPCDVVPDTAFGLPDRFSREVLSDLIKDVRTEADLRGEYIVLQAHPSLKPIVEGLVSSGRLSPDVDIFALPIGPILGDDVSYTLQFLPTAKHLERWPSPREIAGLIANSSGVIAQSLHLSITALAYGLPVLRPSDAKLSKYEVLQASENVHFGSSGDPAGIVTFVNAISGRRRQMCSLATAAQPELKKHWDRIADICLRHRAGGAISIQRAYANANRLLQHLEGIDRGVPSA
jgi:lipopolysaccharide transport system ATP-binding protein